MIQHSDELLWKSNYHYIKRFKGTNLYYIPLCHISSFFSVFAYIQFFYYVCSLLIHSFFYNPSRFVVCLLHAKCELPRWYSGKESACQCRSHRRHGFDPLVGKIPLEGEIATHSSILVKKIPWTEEPDGLHGVAQSWT